jgi:CPA2 family monovalent cation:H+ antiporter-2
MHNIIPILISTVAIATALNVFLKRYGMPTVIGYILTGAIIGSMFGIHIHGNDQLEHVAEFGVVFLMFTIGLEFSFSHLKSMKKEVFLYGVLQVFLSGAVLALVAQFALGIGYKSAIIVGAGMALSSTAIVLKLLNESGKIETEFGRNSLGILIFQDMAVIPILLLITIFTSHDKSISELMTDTAINAVLALGILILIGKLALKHVFKAVSNTNSKEIYMGSILLTVVGASYIAHHFGFSYSLGGFIAGMMIADTIYKYQVEADLIPFRDLLLGVFFVSVGLQIDPIIVIKNIGWVLLLGIIVMVLKTLILFIVLSIAGDKKVALRTALTLAEIGEFSLVVFSLILANNMLDPVMVQIFMVTIIMSMVATPFIINNIDKIVDLFIKGDITDIQIAKSGATGGRVILCGYGSFGEAVSVRLSDAGIEHIIITNNTDAFVRAKEAGKNVVFGDASDRMLLENLHIRDAMSTIIAIDDFEKVKLVRAAITLMDPELKVIARVATEVDKRELTEFNHELLIDGNSHTASLLVDQISRSKLLAQETSSLKYLCDYSSDDPNEAMNLVTLEQARLLDIISKSFNGLREERDIMYIKALHDSFDVLREIIGNAITDIMKNTSLSSSQYNRISTLMDNQQQLVLMNDVLVELAKDLKSLEKEEVTHKFSHASVEALDAVLMSLKDIARDYNDMNIEVLRVLTAEEDGGISKIRHTYLGEEKQLDQKTKAKLLSSTGNMTRLKQLFRTVGANYQKLDQNA